MRLEDVYDMTWAEFCIKSYAHNRIETRRWEHTRWVSYHALIAPYQGDGKQIPRNLTAFLNLNSEPVNLVSEDHKKRFLELAKEYYGRHTS